MQTDLKIKNQGFLKAKSCKLKARSGFTLMEIVVATTIFALVSSALMALFNYTLKINRRSEALRQASQGMRNFVETLVKDIRNGELDYYTSGNSFSTVCRNANGVGGDTYQPQDNKLGIRSHDGSQECIYFANPSGNYVGSGVFVASSTGAYQLVVEKPGSPLIKENLVPSNYRIENLKFIIRPVCDPYVKCTSYGSDYPRIQPVITIFIKFVAMLPTGERVEIYYQTSATSNDYNIPTS